MGFSSLRKELRNLSESRAFDDFERELAVIDREMLSQIKDFGLLVKMRNLASGMKGKKRINDRLRSLHSSLCTGGNPPSAGVKCALDAFLYNEETKIDAMVRELNDFKRMLDEAKKCQSSLLHKSLDNRLLSDGKYGRHIEKLGFVHKKQKNALVSMARMFLKRARSYARSLQNFK